MNFQISTYRVFISHRYIHSEEYQRLVRMLDRASDRDPTWHWQNLSIPKDAPIMTKKEAQQGEIYEERIRQRLATVHVMLYVLRDEWLENLGSLYLELVETTPHYRPTLPIISVLPRGADPKALQYGPPGRAIVKWHPRSIIRAIRENAIPAFAEELRLTPEDAAERARIVETLQANAWRLPRTAAALGMSESTLRRKRIDYIIRGQEAEGNIELLGGKAAKTFL